MTTKAATSRSIGRSSLLGAVLTSAALLVGCGSDSDDPPRAGPGASVPAEIKSLATDADKVTGGDALIEISVPEGMAPDTVVVTLDGRDVSSAFSYSDVDKALTGLVEGLADGDNTLAAEGSGLARSELKLTNHSIKGPVFSGPQEQPFVCQTEQFRVYPNGPLLGVPIDTDCSVETRVDYLYRAVDETFKPLDPRAPLPADLVQTSTKHGVTVPYVVRLETGTINRAIYQIAMLHDVQNEAAPAPTGSLPGWNQRLVYPFGGGCGAGWYRQGNTTGGVLNDAILSQGYGLASSSLNVFGTNCNDVLSAETLMMVKERFVKLFGPPRYTIGWSCSGAAMQQYMIGDNYPGLLDGIIPSCSFPDPSNPASADARLLHNYYNNLKAVPWSEEEITKASGYWGYNHIVNQAGSWSARLDTIPDRDNGYPSALFNAVIPEAMRFNPVTNPTGVRPTHWDHTVNVFGRDPQTGFARRATDNVGVQYGLAALNNGEITTVQFLDLNEKIGGFDINGTFTPERTPGDPEGIRLAYETGRIMLGSGGLASMPIIDWDQIDTEELPTGDLHLKFFHYMTRARLEKSNGSADNMVIWNGGSTSPAYVGSHALARMDEWLANIDADDSAAPRREKVLRNKPADLTDGCWRPAADGSAPTFIAERQFLGTRGTSQCNSLYPGYSYPRGVAGEPAASDIIKCQLKPIDVPDYKMSLTPEESAHLSAVFPDGVCDFTKPGVNQTSLAGTWLRYPGEGTYVTDPAN